jgi:hypothetical protein
VRRWALLLLLIVLAGSLKLRGGAAGRSSVAVAASNRAKKGETALPAGIAARLTVATGVTLQLHLSGGACFEADLSNVTKQEADRFKVR